ncbi:DNA polymerase III subunit beta [Alkalihalobacillus sp. AL-G]|uniref:DNA polymerase III subunit beta n=1 Tax=Alkalihalobacillus sp. AL-G TaxID=2926399 RepID=UPI00272A13F4|nr:DNA polymerase III subunit beta [Alkalihalobacillus sp. AL-G]WLD94293.1 DNA polymerase III subunit beta [Alkalihalobacillus sp. AL-G]
MDILIDKKYFTKAVSEVSKAIQSNPLEPIFSGIKLDVTTKRVTLLGVNGDLFIERFVSESIDGRKVVEINATGSIVVPAKAFHDILKKLPNPISIKTNQQSILIESAEISTTLHSYQSGDFPTPPTYHHDKVTTISNDDLSNAIKQTIFATSNNESRPVLTGINMIFEEGQLTCVATNSQRLAKSEKSIEGNGQGSFIVSGSSLNELVKLLDSDTGKVKVITTDNFLIFKSGAVTVFSRLIAGNYPGVSGLIPRDFHTVLSIKTKQLLEGIERACLFTNESKNNTVHLKLVEGTKLKISSNSTQTGKISETQDLVSLEGEGELNLSFDGRFLLDALKTIKQEVVKMSFGGTMRPVLMEPTNDTSLVHLISPVRTSGYSE